jgi:hypothetical protein
MRLLRAHPANANAIGTGTSSMPRPWRARRSMRSQALNLIGSGPAITTVCRPAGGSTASVTSACATSSTWIGCTSRRSPIIGSAGRLASFAINPNCARSGPP